MTQTQDKQVFGIFKQNGDTETPVMISLNKRKLDVFLGAYPERFKDCIIKEIDFNKIDVSKTRRRLEDKVRKLSHIEILRIAEDLNVDFAVVEDDAIK